MMVDDFFQYGSKGRDIIFQPMYCSIEWQQCSIVDMYSTLILNVDNSVVYMKPRKPLSIFTVLDY